MTDFDRKINDHFPGLVVRKDLTKLVKGNAIVPSYVLDTCWANTARPMTRTRFARAWRK